jgi:hypothetical protein
MAAVPPRLGQGTLGEMTGITHTLCLDGVGIVDLSVDDRGRGRPFLLLHGGAGPPSALLFAERFAASNDVRVINPTHPGFGGTTRPAGLDVQAIRGTGDADLSAQRELEVR